MIWRRSNTMQHRLIRPKRIEKTEVDTKGNEITVIKYEDNTINLVKENVNELKR